MSKKMKFKTLAMAALFAATSSALVAPAYAISTVDECKTQVKDVTRELLKSNVSNDALGAIDAAISAADAACASKDFADAESKITAARDLINSSAQN